MGQGATRRTAGVVVGLLITWAIALVLGAPAAFAHHPEIEGRSVCVEDVPVLEYRSVSWRTDGAPGSANPLIGIYVNGTRVGEGAYNAENGYGFSGSVDARDWADSTVTLTAIAEGNWDNGAPPGDQRSVQVAILPLGCDKAPETTVGETTTTDDKGPSTTVGETTTTVCDQTTVTFGPCETTTTAGDTTTTDKQPTTTVDETTTTLGDTTTTVGDTTTTDGRPTTTVDETTTTAVQPTTTVEETTTTTEGPTTTVGEGTSSTIEETTTTANETSTTGAETTTSVEVTTTVSTPTTVGEGTTTTVGVTTSDSTPETTGGDTTTTAGQTSTVPIETSSSAAPTTTISTVPAQTLPFTGFEMQTTAFIGLMTLGAGAVILTSTRRPRGGVDGSDPLGDWSRD